MKFEKIEIEGACLIRPELREDARGHFARLWCRDELVAQGLDPGLAQINTGFSPKTGTLRGLHLQLPPAAEVKIVRCTRGAVFDVLLDLRRASPTFRHWQGFRLTPADGAMLYIPRGCAHGYLTLEPDTELVYTASVPFSASAARGFHHADPAFAIRWPMPASMVSKADSEWPAFETSVAQLPAEGAAWER